MPTADCRSRLAWITFTRTASINATDRAIVHLRAEAQRLLARRSSTGNAALSPSSKALRQPQTSGSTRNPRSPFMTSSLCSAGDSVVAAQRLQDRLKQVLDLVAPPQLALLCGSERN